MKRFLCVAAWLVVETAAAQDYPAKPIRLIVPFGAGGGSDYVGRLVAQKLTEQMGQTMVVENRPGAASLVGTELAAKSPADGYTLLLADSGFTINPAFYKNTKYDPLKDFEPITVVAQTPYVLVVNPALTYAASRMSSPRRKRSPGRSTSAPPATAAARTCRASSSSCARSSTSPMCPTRAPGPRSLT